MIYSFLFASFAIAAGMIPSVSQAQVNCSAATITPIRTCIIAQNAGGTQYTMVYKLPNSTSSSCLMSRTSNNPNWPFPSYIQGKSNEGGGNPNRPYWMAKREVSGQDYTITNSPGTFVCLRDIGKDVNGDLRGELDTSFANSATTAYNVIGSQITQNLCSTKAANNSISAADYATISSACTSVNLPVKLIDFSARKVANGVALSWTTTNEVNFSHFAIERSSGGAAFAEIGQVLPVSSSGSVKAYAFTDLSPMLSGAQAYRLRMEDLDGRKEYSKVVSVNFDVSDRQALYPNPILRGQSSTLTLSSTSQKTLVIQILNMAGAVLSESSVQVSSGTQNFNLGTGLPSGAYLVRVIDKNDIGAARTHRLTVQ